MVDLKAPAVKSAQGNDAREIFDSYIETGAVKAFEFTAEPVVGVTPGAPAATAPGGPGMGGTTRAPLRPRTGGSGETDDLPAQVSEYEVFTNDGNALTFFMNRHSVLDALAASGETPALFTISGTTITAGTHNHHVFFADLDPPLLATASERGVILLIEFEDKKPLRCTPCYLVKK